ncbi:MAG TPA: 1-deoxy-D-xylulose-5-phosphate reductoisomerase [Candidatus Kapabacteria bacterium]|nr:1-deoxy-D-xylulose-5-phosphate reductoisomerase [Candidatus Kapabacteria bacterium]
MNTNSPNRLCILGSTGSIGTQTLDVVRHNSSRFSVEALSAHSSVDVVLKQIAEFHPKFVVMTDEKAFKELCEVAPKDVDIEFGEEGLEKIASLEIVDTVVAAMVGFAGLRPTIAAIRCGKSVAVANKETLVVAGELLTALAKQSGATITPIDSEHSAIAQCLVGESPDSIKRIILTASGGPFRKLPKDRFNEITLEKALKHPNWVMGRKITIDSATLMNKGLEVIEARWLFDVPLEKVDVIVHPQSIIHSMVEFVDGSIKAQLGAPDMRLPIQYALGYPDRLAVEYDHLDLLKNNHLDFESPDEDRFPALRLAREASSRGGVYPTILNAANEVAVAAFLNEEIAFTDIPKIVEQAMADAPSTSDKPLDASNESAIFEGLERIFEANSKIRGGVETSRTLLRK